MSKYIDADRFRSAMRYSFGESDSYIERGMAKWDSGLWLRYKAVEEVLDAQPAVALAPVKEHDSDHIWYKGKQYISLKRVGEMIKEKTADVIPVAYIEEQIQICEAVPVPICAKVLRFLLTSYKKEMDEVKECE